MAAIFKKTYFIKKKNIYILLKKKKLFYSKKKKKKLFNQKPAILYAVIYVSFGTEFAGLMFGRIDYCCLD